jgi:hypothetical protein
MRTRKEVEVECSVEAGTWFVWEADAGVGVRGLRRRLREAMGGCVNCCGGAS